MKPKTLTIILGMILIVGVMASGITFVSADRELSNVSDVIAIEDLIEDFIAGDTAQASFKYDYIEGVADNVDNSPFILNFTITSSNENYPVWKNDFSITGKIMRYRLFGLFLREIPFSCTQGSSINISHPIGEVTLQNVPNGTFYCYNPEGDLKLDRRDEIYLNISSHPALWPGQYTLTAQLFYLPDIYPPFVNITNKDDFEEKYYNHITNNIEIQAEIIDVNLESWWGIIFTEDQNITLNYEYEDEGIYHFTKTLPGNIQEGNYSLRVFAEDTEGNIGNDSTTLRIDRTPPNITLIEPVGVVSEVFNVKFNVTDEKAGVDNESVQVRLREIVNGQICPETGGPIGNFSCTTTTWIKLDFIGNDIFEKEINTTELNLTSGEYWLDARAKDVLGNKAEWIANGD